MLDTIKVAAYGEKSPSHSFKSLASVSLRSAQVLAVGVFDPSVSPFYLLNKLLIKGPVAC